MSTDFTDPENPPQRGEGFLIAAAALVLWFVVLPATCYFVSH